MTIAALVPCLLMADLNGGLLRFGFVRTQFRHDYKVRPDYLTNTLFMAKRTDVPELKHF